MAEPTTESKPAALPLIVGVGVATTKEEHLVKVDASKVPTQASIVDVINRILSGAQPGTEDMVATAVRATMKARTGVFQRIGLRRNYSLHVDGKPARQNSRLSEYIVGDLPTIEYEKDPDNPVKGRLLTIKVASLSTGGYRV